jgi:hypothetical protein
MSSAPYDTKNEENFEAITRLLNEALRRIERDTSLPATVTELARQADVHRNTIYHRKWPQEELKEIKAKRAQQKKDQASAKSTTMSPEEILEQSRLEIIYWFTQLQEARLTNKSLTASNKQTAAARDHYMREHQNSLELINKLRNDVLKLENTVTILEDEISKLQNHSNA